MLQRFCDTVSVNTFRFLNINVVTVANSLRSFQTYEELIVNTMKFEKIYTTLLYIAYFDICCSENVIATINDHRSTLCVILSEIVLHQWQKTIAKFSTLISIIVHDDRSFNSKFAQNWVSIIVMKEILNKLINWFHQLRYIFDKNDSRISQIVLLSSYETFFARILFVHEKRDENNKINKIFESRWKKIFEMIILNEEQNLRHSNIKTFVNINLLKADFYWFLSITSVMNNFIVQY